MLRANTLAGLMKRSAFLWLSLLAASGLPAQTRIIKEVAEDISTQMKPVSQDNTLVGYLAFTRLEKADADSFNYRVTIMDENLNDIGTVNFRQGLLELQSVSFEQNVLCLGYIQSALSGAKKISHLLLQFINLDGKVVNTFYREASLSTAPVASRSFYAAVNRVGFLKYGMQIRNVPNRGFAFFYGDETKQDLLLFNLRGELTHEQELPGLTQHYYLRTTGTDIYLLTKNDGRPAEGGYKLYLYSSKDLNEENYFDLRDGHDNWLKVLSFDNDPVTGDAFIAGCIINPRREMQFLTPTDYSFAPYIGLFTLDLGNPHKEMHANCSYWSDENIPGISNDGMFADRGIYVRYTTAFKDYNGNTIFAGTALTGKGYVGAAKYRLSDGAFVRQDAAGNIALDNTITCDESKSFGPMGILPELDKKEFYKVLNPDTKTNYMIIDDEVNIYIYNVNQRKLARTIPHKDGNVKINVFPAKEGHMLVAEFNRKEKYTRFSIEAL